MLLPIDCRRFHQLMLVHQRVELFPLLRAKRDFISWRLNFIHSPDNAGISCNKTQLRIVVIDGYDCALCKLKHRSLLPHFACADDIWKTDLISEDTRFGSNSAYLPSQKLSPLQIIQAGQPCLCADHILRDLFVSLRRKFAFFRRHFSQFAVVPKRGCRGVL